MPGLRPARASILVVEDDLALARTLIDALESADYRVWHAASGHEARAYAERAWPDLILLDLLLPDVDGLVLCSLLKGVTDVPIIMCGASTRRSDPVLALKLGADDFVRKPFDIDTLLARIEAVLRRRPPARGQENPPETPPSDELRVGDLLIEPQRKRATLAGAMLALTPTEFKLLTALTTHAESTLTRDRLARDVWGYADASNGRTIDVHIRRLRVKLAHGRAPGPSIVAVRGTGYRITADERAITAA
ncbi:MAG TPA: response regulator transcription factor [Chloroflexota bacterium]|jgi:DNA-binding response OmpR family regulator